MHFTHYEMSPVELTKMIKRIDKYSKMISPQDVVEGQEFIDNVVCQSCNMIPSRPNISQCKKCKSAICNKCYYHAKSLVEDASMDNELNFTDEDDLYDKMVTTPCCPVCKHSLDLEKRSKKDVKMALNKMKFKNTCSGKVCGVKRSF